MDRYRLAFYATAVALAASLVVHGRNVMRAEPSNATPLPAEPLPQPIATAANSGGAGGASTDAECRAQLAECRQASWAIVQRAIEGDLNSRAAATQGEPEEKPTSADATGSDAEAQRKALCEMAQSTLRMMWKAHREPIEAIMRKTASEEWAEGWTEHQMASLREEWELSDGQLEQMEHGYDALWRQHGGRLRKLVSAEQPDYQAVMQASKEFYQGEDQLFSQVLGESGQQLRRAQEVENRSALLALLATLAGQPWDDNLSW